MSKSSELDRTAKRYILDCIDNSGYSETPLNTDKEKINFLLECFKSEYSWAINRYGEPKALVEWLQGLPSSISIVFYNCDILKLATDWGSLPANATEKQQDKILENYWNFMANKISQLFRSYRVPK